MSYNGNANVIFLGHGSVFEEIRSHVADLVAMNQVRRSFWIDTNTDLVDSVVRVLEYQEDGSQKFIDLDQALRGITGVKLVVALDALDGSTDLFTTLDKWVYTIETRVSGGVAKVRALVPRLPLNHTTVAWEQWNSWSTIAVAPEDSDSPYSSASPINRIADPFAAAKVVAPTIVSLAGLWSSSTSVPLLDAAGQAISSGQNGSFRLARAYHRSVDALEVEEKLLERVVDISGQLPLTNLADGRQAVYINDASPVNEYAELLLRQHHSSLLSAMKPENSQGTIQQEGFAALKSFLKEFFLTVIGTPTMWKQALTNTVSEQVAKNIQNGLYGEKSVVEVVIGNSSGKSVSLAKLQNSSLTIQERRTRQQGFVVEPPPSLSVLWEGYTNAALTLVDGADRLQDELAGPRDHNGNPAIVRRGIDSVPDIADSFDGYHPVLADISGMSPEDSKVLPFDVYGAQRFKSELDHALSQTADASVMRVNNEFAAWKEKMSTSFAWRTGEKLLYLLEQAQTNARKSWYRLGELQHYLKELTERDYEAENRQLAKKLRIFTGVWAILFLIEMYCTIRYYQPDWRFFLPNWEGIDWRWALLLIFLTTIIILLIQMQIFMQARRGIIDELERKKLLETNLDIASDNYFAANNDVVRIASAYYQFLSWSTLLGRVIARPFGKPRREASAPPIPTDGMPRSTQLGRAVVDDNAMVSLVNDVRSKMFQTSWAGSALTSFVDDVFAVIKQKEGVNPSRLKELYGQPGFRSNSTLDRLCSWAVGSEMESRDQIYENWEKAISDPSVIAHIDQALNTVEYFEDNQLKRMPREQFLIALQQTDMGQARFSNASVTPVGVNRGATDVEPSASSTDAKGPSSANLTRFVTVSQFGPAVPLSYLVGEDALRSAAPVEFQVPEQPNGHMDPFGLRHNAPSFNFDDSDGTI